MDHEAWLASLVSADQNHEWEELKTLAERRLEVAPGDLNAIFALKKANIVLNPELLREFLAQQRAMEEQSAATQYRYPAEEYISIEPISETREDRQTSLRPRLAWVIVSIFILMGLCYSFYPTTERIPKTNHTIYPTKVVSSLDYELRATLAVIGRDERRIRRTEWAQRAVEAYVADNTSIGFDGYQSDQCVVSDQRTHIGTKSVNDTPYVYIAVPIEDSMYGQQLTYTWVNPDGSQIYQETYELSQQNSNRNCFKSVTYLGTNVLPGVYRARVRLDGELAYWGGITVEPYSSIEVKSWIEENASIGFDGYLLDQCAVRDQRTHIGANRVNGNPNVYMTIPVDESMYGKELTYTWRNPNGSRTYSKTVELSQKNSARNCFGSATYLGVNRPLGIYDVLVTLDGEEVYRSEFTID